jgi:hypothetical protein
VPNLIQERFLLTLIKTGFSGAKYLDDSMVAARDPGLSCAEREALAPRGALRLGRRRGHPRLEVRQGGRPADSGWGRNRNREIGRISEEIHPSGNRLSDWLVSFPLPWRTRAVCKKTWKGISKIAPSCWALAVVMRALTAKSAHRSSADPKMVADYFL